MSLNGQERKTFDEYLTALTGAVVESASKVVQEHSDSCYTRNLAPINEKLERLLAIYSEQRGRMALWAAIGKVIAGAGVLSAIVLGILAAVH